MAWGPRFRGRQQAENCDRGAAYGIPGDKIDGMDVLEVKKAGCERSSMLFQERGHIFWK